MPIFSMTQISHGAAAAGSALGLLALFLAACTSGGGDSGQRRDEGAQQPALTAVAPTSAPEPTAVPKPTAELPSDGGALGGALNPFSLLSGSMFSGGGIAGLPAGALREAATKLRELADPAYAGPRPEGASPEVACGALLELYALASEGGA
jgi:hypothetical protein